MNKLKILLIEDLEVAQIVAINIFKELNCEVTLTDTGVAALDCLIFNSYDMIFLDIQLPDLSGFEITSTIREIERKNKHIPIIAVTANFYDSFPAKCKAVGFDDYILKPLTIETTRHMLTKHASKKKIHGQWNMV